MEAFLEAINQPVTADSVRELVRRYDLKYVMGDDLSDEGLPREDYLEIQETRSLHPMLRGSPSKDGVPVFGQQGRVLPLPGTADSRDYFSIISRQHRASAREPLDIREPGSRPDSWTPWGLGSLR